ncbi:MAG: ECF transporter S component [Clostridiales bacterium]|jgi:riboflavin transporter FmnP|nr:ECF transporter S component [Clostridiales bacterium]
MIKTDCKQRAINLLSVKSMTIMALLGAISVVLMLFEVPLWFAPPFYELDFSEVPVLIGAFALGPVAGIIIEMLKILLNLVITGTDTAGVGELANFLIGCSFIVPASMIYYRNKTIKTAIIGMITGTACMVVLGSFMNAFVLLPAYAYFFKMPVDALIEMGTKVNSKIKSMSSFVFYAVIPFNLLKGVAVSLITLVIYKRISGIIKTLVGTK